MSAALAFIEPIESVLPTQNDSKLARESSQQLAHLLGGLGSRGGKTARTEEPVKIEIRLDGKKEIVALPSSALEFLNQILVQMAQGKAISIQPHNRELTTMEAAEILNVSRPFLIGLLDKHQLPYRKVGTHRRIRFDDVMNFKQDVHEKRLGALRKLSQLSQELGLDE